MLSYPSEDTQKGAEADSRYEKRYAQTQGIRPQENYPLSHRILITGHQKTAPQNRSDTGGPAEGKC